MSNYQRVILTLSPDEKKALLALAGADLRDPKDQIRWILREEAERRQLWPPAPIMSEVQLCAT